jgi:hypothetical protein
MSGLFVRYRRTQVRTPDAAIPKARQRCDAAATYRSDAKRRADALYAGRRHLGSPERRAKVASLYAYGAMTHRVRRSNGAMRRKNGAGCERGESGNTAPDTSRTRHPMSRRFDRCAATLSSAYRPTAGGNVKVQLLRGQQKTEAEAGGASAASGHNHQDKRRQGQAPRSMPP